MKYKCNFPYCGYETNNKSKIDFHHIVPKEIGGHNGPTISLCKNHHAMIYHPLVKFGQHSIKCDESLIIHQTYKSSEGIAIHYENMEGEQFYWLPDSGIKDLI
jgi:hypothetical protein